MTKARSTWKISKETWHGRWYMYWREHATWKKHGYKENLCHYVRVILFWAPIAWLSNYKPVKKINWPIVAYVPVLAAVGLAIYAIVVEPLTTLMFAGMAVGVLALSAGIIWLLDRYHKEIGGWFTDQYWNWGRSVLFAIGHAIAWLATPLVWLAKTAWEIGGRRVGRTESTTIGEIFFGTVVGLLLVTLLIAAALDDPVGLAWVLGTIAVGGALIYATVVWLKKHARPLKEDSIVYVMKDTVVAKKHRICPLIDVDEEQEETLVPA